MYFKIAVACISSLNWSALTWSARGRARLSVARVAPKSAGRRKFTQLMTNHVFRHKDRHMLAAVMHSDRQTNKIRCNRRPPRPGLNRSFASTNVNGFHLLSKVVINKRPLSNRSRHRLRTFLPAPPSDDHRIRTFIYSCFVALGGYSPRCHRMSAP